MAGDPAAAHPPGAPHRKQRLLSTIDRNGNGVEISPGDDPVAPKAEGFNVHAVEDLAEVTGRPNHYDWIIASHVIEHMPDLIAFLGDCDAILNDRGVLSLMIADKRHAFERARPISGIAAVIDAHVAGQKAPSQGALAEHRLYAAGHQDVHTWCFVPHAFRLLVEDLHLLGYTRLREVGFHPTERGEFYAALGRGGRGPGLPRLELLRAVDAEVAAIPRD